MKKVGSNVMDREFVYNCSHISKLSMGPILLWAGHRGVSEPLRLLRYAHRPMFFCGEWAFLNCLRSGRARVWLAMAADRADSVSCEAA